MRQHHECLIFDPKPMQFGLFDRGCSLMDFREGSPNIMSGFQITHSIELIRVQSATESVHSLGI